MPETSSISTSIARVYDLGTFLQRIRVRGISVLGTTKATVFFFEPASRRLRLVSLPPRGTELFELAEGQGVAGNALSRIAEQEVILFEGNELIDTYVSDPESPTNALPRLIAVLTVTIRLIGEAAYVFCFDFEGKENTNERTAKELTPTQREATKQLTQELLSPEVRNALCCAWVSQSHMDILAAGLRPETLRKRAGEFLSELGEAFRTRGGPEPTALKIQLVDHQRNVIHQYLSTNAPLGLEDAWSHSLDSNDIHADILRRRVPEMIVGNDPKRFQQYIYRKHGHARLSRLWIPLIPFHTSLPSSVSPRFAERELAKRIRWVEGEFIPEQLSCRHAKWLTDEPPEGSAYGTLSIAFERQTFNVMDLSPWTDELALWCTCQAWTLGAELFSATRCGALERIGQLCFSLSAAKAVTLVTPGPEPTTLDHRRYPYEKGATWRIAPVSPVLPIGDTSAASDEEECLYYDSHDAVADPKDDIKALRKTTAKLAKEATARAANLYDRALEVLATYDLELTTTSAIGTEDTDTVVENICRDACRESKALSARYYTFDESWPTDDANRWHRVGAPVAWPRKNIPDIRDDILREEQARAFRLANTGNIPRETNQAHTESADSQSNTATDLPLAHTTPRPEYGTSPGTGSPTALLPFELTDRTRGVLALTFPPTELLSPERKLQLERRAARWLQRVSARRLVLIERFSSAVTRLRQAVATAKQRPGANPGIRDFLESFCAAAAEQLASYGVLGVLATFDSAPMHDNAPGDAESLPEDFSTTDRVLAWTITDTRSDGTPPKTVAFSHQTCGTTLQGPCLEASTTNELVRWGTDGSKGFQESVLTLASIPEPPVTVEAASAIEWLRSLPGEIGGVTAFTFPVPVRHAGMRCRAALTVFLVGVHHMRSRQRSLLIEFGSYLGETLGAEIDKRQQQLRSRHEQQVTYRCIRLATNEGENDPIGILLARLGGAPPSHGKTNSPPLEQEPKHWGLAEDVVLWSIGHDNREIIAYAGRGAGSTVVTELPRLSRKQHPWFAQSHDNSSPTLKLEGGFRLSSFDLRANGLAYPRLRAVKSPKPWLVSIPIADAQSRCIGLLDLLRDSPIPPDEHAILERQFARLVAEFCASLERGRHRRIQTLTTELHAEAAELLRRYRTPEVHDLIVQQLSKHFRCEHADLFLRDEDRMILAASTLAKRTISHDQRAALTVHVTRPNAPVGRGEGDALARMLEADGCAKPSVVHECDGRSTEGLSSQLRAFLAVTLRSERLIVPIFGTIEQSGHLVAVFQLVAPYRMQPQANGHSWFDEIAETRELAQVIEPVLRQTRAFEVAAELRGQRERADALQDNLVSLQGFLLEEYREEWGSLVREDTPWKAIMPLIEAEESRGSRTQTDTPAKETAGIRGLCTCEYLGYRSRLAWARTKPVEDDIDPVPFCDASPSEGGGNKLNAAYAEADELLRTQHLVVECKDLLVALRENEGQSTRESESNSYGIPTPRECIERLSLAVLEHGWRLILKGAQRVSQPAVQKSQEDKAGAPDAVRRTAAADGAAPAWPPPLDELHVSAKELMRLSVRLFAQRIEAGWDEELAGLPETERMARQREQANASIDGPPNGVDPPNDRGVNGEAQHLLVGRTVLWSYLGCLLAKSTRLANTYLATKEGIWPVAPQDPSRDYLIQLSRFFLGLVELLERYHNTDTRTRTVSPAERLDALVYLVDRYAHIELGVPEWLDLRHHLARALPAEIEHHLRSSFYRDHLLHVIDVFLLGHLILSTETRLRDPTQPPKPYAERLNLCVGYCGGFEGCTCSGRLELESCHRNWAVASLLHDIGYQVVRNGQLNFEPDSWDTYFEVDATAPKSVLARKGEQPERHLERLLGILREAGDAQSVLRDLPNTLTDERLNDHGVLSSLRVAQLLSAMGQRNPVRSNGEGRLLAEYEPAIHAIYFHNLGYAKVAARTHPLSCLLRLCDELQEWGRHRVNIEGVVKQLYLAIEGEPSLELDKRRLVSQLELNVGARWKPSEESDKDTHDELTFELNSTDLTFRVKLDYQDPKPAAYDPVLTLLMKAYSLQHLDFSGPDRDGDRPQQWQIELHFPRSMDRGTTTEYDIYCQFAERRSRWLPMLPLQLESDPFRPGLARLLGKGDAELAIAPDRFIIVTSGRANSNMRHGWLTSDPKELVKTLGEFRKSYLMR